MVMMFFWLVCSIVVIWIVSPDAVLRNKRWERKVYKECTAAHFSILFILSATVIETLANKTHPKYSIEMPSYVVTGASRGLGVSATLCETESR